MDFQRLSGYFIRGDVRSAIEYMSEFPELQETVNAYRDIFENENYLQFEIPEKLNQILLQYQKYFRNLFYLQIQESEADNMLIHDLCEVLELETSDETEIVSKMTALFESFGYHIKTGTTNGHYGPYVWKETVKTEFEVELPDGNNRFTVNILKGFIMRSWMAYLTFGKYGTKGWADHDGLINCIEGQYDFDSEEFLVSLLKHEAQHVVDMKKWKDITPAELEYRAKLVELIYSKSGDLFEKFLSEASGTRKEDSHAIASERIRMNMAEYLGRSVEEIQIKAKELFDLSSD